AVGLEQSAAQGAILQADALDVGQRGYRRLLAGWHAGTALVLEGGRRPREPAGAEAELAADLPLAALGVDDDQLASPPRRLARLVRRGRAAERRFEHQGRIHPRQQRVTDFAQVLHGLADVVGVAWAARLDPLAVTAEVEQAAVGEGQGEHVLAGQADDLLP